MKLSDFIKEKLPLIILLLVAIATIEIFLMMYEFELFLKIYIPTILLIVCIIGMSTEYFRKKSFYQETFHYLEELKEKYMMAEVIQETNFIEGKLLKELLEETNKSMIEKVNEYKYLQEDYKDYIELWIHEIKTPIATSKMIIENNKTQITKSIEEELDKIENYIEQALFYARSNTVEKDYCIKECELKEIVNQVIKKNKSRFIQEKIKITLKDLEKTIYTDSKWCIFILNQLIQNSIQYQKIGIDTEIEIQGKEKKDQIILILKDNGIGIKKGEITRVFDKGFTGSNGRKTGKKSTGIGLYLCQKLCDKLGLAIELNSIEEQGTEVKVIFPKNSFIIQQKK